MTFRLLHLAVGLLVLGAAPCALGQAAPPPQTIEAPQATEAPQTIVLADLGLHVVGAGVQRTVAPRVALQANLDWYVPWTQTEEALDTMGFVLRLRPMFYLTDEAPEGFWISPFVQGGFATAEVAGESRVGLAAALGVSAGYALLLLDHLHLAIGAGGQYHAVVLPGPVSERSFRGAYPHADATVGYAF
jgi:hypothetical protein